MGWSCSRKPAHLTPCAYIIEEALQWSLPASETPKIVAQATAYGACYYAIEFPAGYVQSQKWPLTYYKPHQDGSVTAAAIILYRRSGGEFCWKDQTETMGPVASDCPEHVLAKLSELKDDDTVDGIRWAREWRQRCRDKRASRNDERRRKAELKPGMIVTLPKPLTFSGGHRLARFEVVKARVKRGRKLVEALCFQSTDTGLLCRITGRQLEGAVYS